MKQPVLFLAASIMAFPVGLHAQSYGRLEANQVSARFSAHGLIGMDLGQTRADFEVPMGNGAHPLFSAGLWIGGIDPINQLHLAAQSYEGSVNGDFWTGPLTVDGTANITPAVAAFYDRVWSVTRAEVQAHRAYFDCVNDPNCDENVLYPNGYVVPPAFLTWPAIGDVQLDQALYLAPFVDYDADGNYDPMSGDHPCFPGDEALYFIFNDRKLHVKSGGSVIGVEVHGLAYAFGSGDPALDQTVFLHYRIINRGTLTLSDTQLGMFTDFDLGNGADDLVGTDVSRGLTYVFNGDNDDESGLSNGYGVQPPAFGLVHLAGALLDPDGTDDPVANTLPAYNGSGFGDGIVDNERYGLTVSRYFSNVGGATGDPITTEDHYAQLLGYWNDGSAQLYGGTGHMSDPNADPNTISAFAYPEGSDPYGVGTNGLPQSSWSELTAGNLSGDRRMLSAQGPFTLEPGEHVHVDYAFVFARAGSGGPWGSVQALQQRTDSVRAFFHAELGPALMNEAPWCPGGVPTGIRTLDRSVEDLEFFPNPATDQVRISLPSNEVWNHMTVHDATGRVVISDPSGGGKQVLDVSGLAPGHYVVRIGSAGRVLQGRFVKE